ncbi:MAG: AI-2E family transporter [Ignavibacteriales bacterium]
MVGLTAALILLWYLRGILVMAFASVLIGIAIVAVAEILQQRTRLPRGLALAAVVLSTIAFVVGAVALFGYQVADQYDAILAKAAVSVRVLTGFAEEHAWARGLIDRLGSAPLDGAAVSVAPRLAFALGTVGQGLAYVAIVIASGIFLAVDPRRHMRGILALVPASRRDRVEAFLGDSGAILRKWLVSRLTVMLVIGVLSSMGLRLLGIDGAITLGVTGGLLTFIPLIGALIAAVPAVLVAFAQSPLLALYTALMYWAVHFIEGTFITPYVQDEQVQLPPVITLYSTLVFAALFGIAGVFFASPLALVGIVGVKAFYLKSATVQARKERARGQDARARLDSLVSDAEEN